MEPAHGDDEMDVLARPLDVYRRFSDSEVTLMKAFTANVRELESYSFFSQIPTKLTLSAARGGPVDARMKDPLPEATRAAAALFRQLYWHKEEANFDKTMKLLKANVHQRNSSYRDEAIAALEDLYVGQKEILDYGVGIALVFGDGQVSNRLRSEAILATYLNGVWLHTNNDKSRRAKALDQAPPVARFTFYGCGSPTRLRNKTPRSAAAPRGGEQLRFPNEKSPELAAPGSPERR